MDTNELSLRREAAKHVEQAELVIEKAKGESRSLSHAENQEVVSRMNDFDALQDRLAGMGHPIKYWRDSGLTAIRQWLGTSANSPVERPIPQRSGTAQTTRTDDKGMVEFRNFLRGERRGLVQDLDTSGGYTVPENFLNEVLKDVEQLTTIRELSRVIKINSGDSLRLPKLSTRPDSASWTSELNIGPEANAQFQAVGFNLHPFACYMLLSNDLRDSTAISIEELVKNEISYLFAKEEEKAFITGSGAGRPLGFMTSGTGGAGVTAARDCSVAATSSAFTADTLIETFYTLEPGYQQNSTWCFHPDALKLIRKLKTGDGQYIWQIGLQSGEPARILERPVAVSQFMPNTFSTGLYVGAIADFKRGYWIVQLTQLKIQTIDQLWAASNQVGFIARMRLDAQPVNENCFARVKLA